MKITIFTLLFFIPIITICQAVEPIYLTLNGDINDPNQEISGLAWHDDELILLPQYAKDVVYSISKNDIVDLLNSEITTITPNEISWRSADIEALFEGFEGYEAIAFAGDEVYITIETENSLQNAGIIVRGKIYANQITLDPNSLMMIKPPISLNNMTFETIVIDDREIFAIYEINSEKLNYSPVFYRSDKELKSYNKLPFPAVEYRITDATKIDEENKFWVTNYFWPGDYEMLKPDLNYPVNNPKDIRPVERLLEFQIIENEIVRTDSEPIEIILSEFGDSRNWEGIVRLDDIGFLIVTDKFPGTILAFVPFPKN